MRGRVFALAALGAALYTAAGGGPEHRAARHTGGLPRRSRRPRDRHVARRRGLPGAAGFGALAGRALPAGASSGAARYESADLFNLDGGLPRAAAACSTRAGAPASVLRRGVLTGRQDGVGVGRRPGRRCTSSRRRGRDPRRPSRARRLLAGGPGLRPDAARAAAVRRQQPRRRPRRPARAADGHREPARPHGDRDRPDDRRRSRTRSTSARRWSRSAWPSTARRQGVRDAVDGPVRGGDRHRTETKSGRHPAVRRPARRRPPERGGRRTRVRDEVYTANANSDTVSVIDTPRDTVSGDHPGRARARRARRARRPTASPSRPTARSLYVALAGENAIAVIDLDHRAGRRLHPDLLVSRRRRRDARTAASWWSRTRTTRAPARIPCGGLLTEGRHARVRVRRSLPTPSTRGSMIKGSRAARDGSRAPPAARGA